MDKKYVFHIPLHKFEDGELVLLEIDDLLDDLISQLDCEGMYFTRCKSVYKSRRYDELLLTVFASCDDNLEDVFKGWFSQNNDVLGQEALAYECDGKLFVEEFHQQ